LHLELVAHVAASIVQNVEQVILGKRRAVVDAVATLLARGHVLLQDVPGVGKTMLARSLAVSVGGVFKRLQCTPDLLPSDITGVTLYDQRQGAFRFRAGPVFSNVLLADEINRTSPRTQSSLLECMDERQVTVDGRTHPLPQPFLVIATENPSDHEGVYPLPESQLDRFMTRLWLDYPTEDDEKLIVGRHLAGAPIDALESVTDPETVRAMQAAVETVQVNDEVVAYAVALCRRTRVHPHVALGASTRATLQLSRLAQAHAVLAGRDYVLPDDVKRLALAVLAHRITLKPEARLEDMTPETVIQEIRDEYPVATSARPPFLQVRKAASG